MDDRRRVDDHFDLVVRDTEEPVRLDQLETLVRQRRRVHSDLSSHRPRRMCERLLHRHREEFLTRPASKRPAGGGQHERVDGVGLAPPLETLVDRGMLAVDGDQPPAATVKRRAGERAARDQALLVRQRQSDAVLERPERRADAGEADDRVQDDIRPGRLEQRRRVSTDLGQRTGVRGDDLVARTRARRDRAQLEVGVGVDDLERLTTDRSGCSEESDTSHHVSVYELRAHVTRDRARGGRRRRPVPRRRASRGGRGSRRGRRAGARSPLRTRLA